MLVPRPRSLRRLVHVIIDEDFFDLLRVLVDELDVQRVVEVGVQALGVLEQHEQAPKFALGELDALVSEGEADIAEGDVLELDEVFKQLRRMSAARRAAIPQKSK